MITLSSFLDYIIVADVKFGKTYNLFIECLPVPIPVADSYSFRCAIQVNTAQISRKRATSENEPVSISEFD